MENTRPTLPQRNGKKTSTDPVLVEDQHAQPVRNIEQGRLRGVVAGPPGVPANPPHLLDPEEVDPRRNRGPDPGEALVIAEAPHLGQLPIQVQP